MWVQVPPSASSLLLGAAAALLLACAPAPPVWETLVEAAGGALYGVHARAPDDVLAVGADVGMGPELHHFDGEDVRREPVPAGGGLWWAAGGPGEHRTLVGERGRVFERAPAGELSERRMPAEATLFGAFVEGGEALYVGGDPLAPTAVVWRERDGAAAAEDVFGGGLAVTPTVTVFKVHGFAGGSRFLVGQRGRAFERRDGAWAARPSPTRETLLTVHGPRRDRLFAVGGFGRGVILRFDGERWFDESPPGLPGLSGVFATEERAVAVGMNGAVFERGADGVWRALEPPAPTFEDLHAVAIDEEGAIHAVGGVLVTTPGTRGVWVRYGSPR